LGATFLRFFGDIDMRHLLSKVLLSVLAFVGCFGLGALVKYAGQQIQAEYRASVAPRSLPRVVSRTPDLEVLSVDLMDFFKSVFLMMRNNGSRPIKGYKLESSNVGGRSYLQVVECDNGHPIMPGDVFVISVPYSEIP
jgi:hypothetical protein